MFVVGIENHNQFYAQPNPLKKSSIQKKFKLVFKVLLLIRSKLSQTKYA